MITNYYKAPIVYTLLFLTILSGCKKLVDIPAPRTAVSSSAIYSSDAAAASALTGIYATLSSENATHTGLGGMYLYQPLSADELTLYDQNNALYRGYYLNNLSSSSTVGSDPWTNIYPVVYYANAAIAGLSNNTALTPAVQKQLLGEAKFVRAFCYFYLVNFYGDIPLPLTTKYEVNTLLARAPRDQVYQQIITDLKDAESLLSTNFLDGTITRVTTERVRPVSAAASTLLARTYLYLQKWDSAEAAATKVINNPLFSLDSLNDVFLSNSSEAIWQWQPVETGVTTNTGEGSLFVLPDTGPNSSGTYPVYLSDHVLNSFEPGDGRRIDWVDSIDVGGTIYHYPYKYKIGTGADATQEYATILRLSELYLIRAEARVQQNKLTDGRDDLNVIRTRARLDGSSANIQADLLKGIAHERQVELFTEGGHRWFDLKRTGAIDAVMGAPGNVCQQKGGHWDTNWQLYPIPLTELQAEPALVQNKGY